MKNVLKKPVLIALILSLVSYCIYVTVSNLALIYLEVISIFIIGFIYVYEFKEPMPRDLRMSVSIYFVIFSIIIYFTNDTYDLLRHIYTPALSVIPSFAFYLSAILVKELMKSPLLFVATYMFLYISGRIYLNLNKYSIKVTDKRILHEPVILAILIASAYVIAVPMSDYNITELYKFVFLEVAFIFSIGTIYTLKFKETIPAQLKMETAIYFSIITFIIYFLNFTHNYCISSGSNILDNNFSSISFYSFGSLFINKLYFDTFIAVTFLRFAAVYTFFDIPGKIYFYLKKKLS
jgi:hypothetical protein